MRIAILGCGWLGIELAKKLKKENHEVRGSVANIENMAKLREAKIIPYNIKLFEKGVQGDIRSFFSGCHVIIIAVPPGLRKNPKVNFVKKMRKVLPYVEKADPQKIIYISSTGVYKDEPGFPEYDENASTNNSSDKAIQLRNAELLFLNHKNWNISVVRFGGLFGGDRHPVKYLAGKKELKNPDAPVNLVHREDCINALEKLIGLKKDHSVWNVVYPEHPTRRDYYQREAREKGLEIPDFLENKKQKGKIISSRKLIDSGFKFQHPI